MWANDVISHYLFNSCLFISTHICSIFLFLFFFLFIFLNLCFGSTGLAHGLKRGSIKLIRISGNLRFKVQQKKKRYIIHLIWIHYRVLQRYTRIWKFIRFEEFICKHVGPKYEMWWIWYMKRDIWYRPKKNPPEMIWYETRKKRHIRDQEILIMNIFEIMWRIWNTTMQINIGIK